MNVGVMSLIIFIVGIFILVYGMFFSPTEEEEKMFEQSLDLSGVDKVLSELQDRINDADKMIMELDKFSNHVQSENEKKYKELMLLYKLIDEKQQDVDNAKDEIKRKEEEMIRQERQKLIEANRRLEQERIMIERKKNMGMENIPSPKQFYYEPPKNNIPSTISAYKEAAATARNAIMPAINQSTVAMTKTKKNNFDEVVYLYESGKNIDEIAKALGKGKGEIRLMLDLMGKEE